MVSGLVTIATFDNPIEANISKGKLEIENISCTLFDENIVSINWLFNNPVGGIKLKVTREDAERARKLLEEEIEPCELKCPVCESKNVSELKAAGWVKGIIKFLSMLVIPILVMLYMGNRRKILTKYKCSDCGYKFDITTLY